MIFSDEALKVSKYAQMSLENQLKHYKHLPLADEYEEQGRFFSNEFAHSDVRPGEDYKYKITSACVNYLWANTKFKGITYPSVLKGDLDGADYRTIKSEAGSKMEILEFKLAELMNSKKPIENIDTLVEKAIFKLTQLDNCTSALILQLKER